MNENNQPQSQQMKREPGYYWVKMEGFQWRIAGWNGSEWTVPGSLSVFGDDWFEIDERRIERSHSPTEQPGDAGFNKLVMDTFHELYPYSSGPHLNELFVMAERAAKYERAKAPDLLSEVSTLRSKQAELVVENEKLRDERNGLRYDLFHVTAERDELNNAIAHVWKALGITDYTGKHISEHVSELRSELDKMSEALESLESLAQAIEKDFIENPMMRVSNTDMRMIHQRIKSALPGTKETE